MTMTQPPILRQLVEGIGNVLGDSTRRESVARPEESQSFKSEEGV